LGYELDDGTLATRTDDPCTRTRARAAYQRFQVFHQGRTPAARSSRRRALPRLTIRGHYDHGLAAVGQRHAYPLKHRRERRRTRSLWGIVAADPTKYPS